MLSSRFRRRLLWGLSIVGVTGLLAGMAIAWAVGGMLLSPQNREIGPPPTDLLCDVVSIPSQSGSTLAGWHVRADHSSGVVVVVHGIGNSRLGMVPRARLLRDAGYSVVLIDLQAHGESPGQRVTLGQLEQHDVRAAVQFARQQHPGEPVGVIGVSLGGAAAVLGSPLGVEALVLESVFPRIQDAVANRIPRSLGPLRSVPAFLLLAQLRPRLGCAASELCPLDRISQSGCPVFVMSGELDQNTTAAESERLFTAAAEPREFWLVPRAGHDDLCDFVPVDYQEHLLKFLKVAFAR